MIHKDRQLSAYDEIQEDKPAGHCQPQPLFAAVEDRTAEERTAEDETPPTALPCTYNTAWMANPPPHSRLQTNWIET